MLGDGCNGNKQEDSLWLRRAPPLDFSELGRSAVGSLVKGDQKAWPALCQFGLFEPSFFAAVRDRSLHECAGDSLTDTELAAFITCAGFEVLARELRAGGASYPLHSAAMLLSFPQVTAIPEPRPGADEPDWHVPESAHALDPYWARHFPDLEAATIDAMLQVRLLERKSGASRTYGSLVSSYHCSHFRRVAAIKLIDDAESQQRIAAPLPSFDVRWGDAARTRTEIPLFVSLIASLYQAVYEAIDFGRPLPDPREQDAGPVEIARGAAGATVPSAPGPHPTSVVLRYGILLLLAVLPTIYNVFHGHRTTIYQILFDTLLTNVSGALMAASLIGYVRQSFAEQPELYHRMLHRLSLGLGGLVAIAAVLWSGQENIKWPHGYVLISSMMLNLVAFATNIYFVIMNISLFIVCSYERFSSRGRADQPPFRYPVGPFSAYVLFSAGYFLPRFLLPQAGLDFSPNGSFLNAGLAFIVPIATILYFALLNSRDKDEIRLPAGWLVAVTHSAIGAALLVAHQFMPHEPISGLLLVAIASLLLALVVPPLWFWRQRGQDAD